MVDFQIEPKGNMPSELTTEQIRIMVLSNAEEQGLVLNEKEMRSSDSSGIYLV